MKEMKIFWGDEFEGHIVRVCKDFQKVCLQPNTGTIYKTIFKANFLKILRTTNSIYLSLHFLNMDHGC